MPAPQQSQTPVYKETANIPRPNTAYYTFNERDNPGYALARALGVGVDKVGANYADNKAKVQAEEDEINAAHAQLGLERYNADQAMGKLDMMFGDYNPDAYSAKQGQLAGLEFAGALRDKYLSDGMDKVDDPDKYAQWLSESIAEQAAAAQSKGVPYYSSFIREVGGGAQGMSTVWAGHAQTVVERRTAAASKQRLANARKVDQVTTNERELQGWMQRFLVGESSGNFNALAGRSGNTSDLSEMTLGELYQFQIDEPGNSAAGLIQLTPGTLRDKVFKEGGFSKDLKYTPELQMEIGLFLMKDRGLTKYLTGKMSEAQFIDNLSSEWGAIKNASGVGNLDGINGNKATQDTATTRKMLAELRVLLDENPRLKAYALDKGDTTTAGTLISTDDASPTMANQKKALDDEVGIGASNVIQRDQMVDLMVDDLENGTISPDDIDWEGKGAKLSTAQREKLQAAADSARAASDYQAHVERNAKVENLDSAIRKDDPEALSALRKSEPGVYQRLMQIKSGAVAYPHVEQTTEAFQDKAAYGTAEFPESAMEALLAGEITQDTYSAAMDTHDAQIVANRLLRMPGVRKPLLAIEASVPANYRADYRAAMALALKQIVDNSPDQIPVLEILQTAKSVAQEVAASAQAQNEDIMGNYQLGE